MAERHHTPRHVSDVDVEPEPVLTLSPEPVETPAVIPDPEPSPSPTPSPPSAQTLPSAHLMPGPAAPTLIHAFAVLCAALQGQWGDNQVQAQHCDEIQAWMSNAGGDIHHANSIVAWRHAVALLAEVLGQPMTLG